MPGVAGCAFGTIDSALLVVPKESPEAASYNYFAYRFIPFSKTEILVVEVYGLSVPPSRPLLLR